jgi:hypothetical protein
VNYFMEHTQHINAITDLLAGNTWDTGSSDDPVPHCPNPACRHFSDISPGDTSWRTDHGSYQTKAFGEVPRFRCTDCGKTFSTQTFRMDYYLKYPIQYLPFIQYLVSTCGQGTMSRFSGYRYEVIQNRLERGARFFLALHAALRPLINVEEHFVLDGFESFSRSQYYPNNINILVGSTSELIYGMGFSQLRRKGRMTAMQKAIREKLEAEFGRAPKNAIEVSVAKLIADICQWLSDKGFGKKLLKSDCHTAYVRALKSTTTAAEWLDHHRYSSTEARTVNNPLFPVNYVDRQIRKDQINHVRETVQFARCPAAMMIRLSIYQGYHNYLMPRRVRRQRKGDWTTRAEALGIQTDQILTAIRRLWGRRIFLHKTDLWDEETDTWLMRWRNNGIDMGRRVPAYVFL